LAPGLRRRTPGLRREEVAQLAGVGVTWYTWLEQGRPINASVQVLDAIARVFKLGPAERWHLYRLADVPGVPTGGSDAEAGQLPAEVPGVLDSLDPTAACVYNGRYDLLACNETYAALFPILVSATGRERNALWQIFTMRKCPLLNVDVLPHMVAVLRANYARHVGEPQWTDFVAALSAARSSPSCGPPIRSPCRCPRSSGSRLTTAPRSTCARVAFTSTACRRRAWWCTCRRPLPTRPRSSGCVSGHDCGGFGTYQRRARHAPHQHGHLCREGLSSTTGSGSG